MSNVTVNQLAEVVKISVDKLISQLNEAGVVVENASDEVTDEQKMTLLKYLRESHGKGGESDVKKKITLKRKRVTELKVGSKRGASSTISIEVRKKKNFAPKPVVEGDQVTPVASAPLVKGKMAELAEQMAAERKAIQDMTRRQKAEEQQQIEEKTKKQQEEEQQKQKEEQLEQKKPVENGQQTKQAEAEKTTVKRSKGRVKKAPEKGTRYGRNELHVASGKHGRRKAKAKHQPAVNIPVKHQFEKPVAPVVREVAFDESISVTELAQQMAVKSSEVIKALMGMGVMATINQVLDEDTATLVVEEMGHTVGVLDVKDLEKELVETAAVDDTRERKSRPPVVTIMGHVDHGKTSLLDYIRKAKVTEGEAGGITQHIGAYQAATDNGLITFLDTPGHAAFSAMRSRGAQATDIVILVVAADDSVMPQTIEAIEHTRAAGAPMIVAINKIDKEGADPEKVKNELSQHDVIPEDWGGDTMIVNVSALTGEGVDKLLDAILLQAELLELTAPEKGYANGIVIESSLEKGRGPVITVLIQGGTLKQGDILIAGSEYGRVRAIFNEERQQIKQAGASTPVQVLGLSGISEAGSDVLVVKNERKAREVAELRQEKSRQQKLVGQQARRMENLFGDIGTGKQTVNILVKSDVQGSAEAIRDSLQKLSTDEIVVNIVSSNVGGINESDINLALASDAITVGFNVRADATARKLAEESKMDLRYYSIIYDLIDDVKQAMSGLLSPELREEIVGVAEVKDVFKSSAFGTVAGCMVIDGVVKSGNPIRVLRDNVVIYEGELESLRRHKDDVKEVRAGTECGIAVKKYNDVKVGDQIENFERTEIQRFIE